MIALIEAFSTNADTLKEVYIHDNWVKDEAVEKLAQFIFKAKKLEVLNISDSQMGNKWAHFLFRALKDSAAT